MQVNMGLDFWEKIGRRVVENLNYIKVRMQKEIQFFFVFFF